MSLHKLTAGSGYDYLTRQVAALDATEKGHVGLASYYTERAKPPGCGSAPGMAGIDGLNAGDLVTAEQMRALFGVGLHPLAEQRREQLEGPDLTDAGLRGGDPAGGAVQGRTPTTSARSGSRWRKRIEAIEPRPIGLPARLAGAALRTGPGSAPRWPRSCSAPSTAGSRSMPASWPGTIAEDCRGRRPQRSPGTT